MAITALAAALVGIAACGGDNLALCEGCEAPTATPSVTPSANATAPESVTAAALSATPVP